MIALRILGYSVQHFWIDDVWTECDIYGSAAQGTPSSVPTSRHIRAHVHTYIALYQLALELFFTEKSTMKAICSLPAHEVQCTCVRPSVDRIVHREGIGVAIDHPMQTTNEEIILQLETWVAQTPSAMLISMMNYIHHVESILFFVDSIDIDQHLPIIAYTHVWSWYIADMHGLQTSDQDTWRETQHKNICAPRVNPICFH